MSITLPMKLLLPLTTPTRIPSSSFYTSFVSSANPNFTFSSSSHHSCTFRRNPHFFSKKKVFSLKFFSFQVLISVFFIGILIFFFFGSCVFNFLFGCFFKLISIEGFVIYLNPDWLNYESMESFM